MRRLFPNTDQAKSQEPTDEQKKVISLRSKYGLIAAVPGSGKTFSLVGRAKQLPEYESKLILAFNKIAAEDFQAKMGICMSAKVKTFHSFCLGVILQNPQNYGYTQKPRVETDATVFYLLQDAAGAKYDSWADSPWDEDFIKDELMLMYNKDIKCYSEQNKPHIWWDELTEIKKNEAKKKGLIWVRGDNDDEIAWDEETIELETTLREYESCQAVLNMREFLLRCNMITFSEMVRIVAENRLHLGYFADHILVDEFQDVDQLQFDIVVALATNERVKTLCVVGDPNQRIYEWRGALEDAFLSFKEEFPIHTELKLTNNFRSKDEIIRHADRICPARMKGVRGSDKHSVKKFINNMKAFELFYDKKTSLEQHAILCRYNRDVAKWSITLAKKGIPVIALGKGDFWNLGHVKLAMQARDMGLGVNELFGSPEWMKLMKKSKYRKNEDTLKEAVEDARFVIGLSKSDMDLLTKNLSNRDGIRVSTIHKTKGSEWKRVFVSDIDERLMRESCVHYVACTRAKDVLIMNSDSFSNEEVEDPIEGHVPKKPEALIEKSKLKEATGLLGGFPTIGMHG